MLSLKVESALKLIYQSNAMNTTSIKNILVLNSHIKIVGRDAVQFGRGVTTFRRNLISHFLSV
jgi:hypothetical protein